MEDSRGVKQPNRTIERGRTKVHVPLRRCEILLSGPAPESPVLAHRASRDANKMCGAACAVHCCKGPLAAPLAVLTPDLYEFKES